MTISVTGTNLGIMGMSGNCVGFYSFSGTFYRLEGLSLGFISGKISVSLEQEPFQNLKVHVHSWNVLWRNPFLEVKTHFVFLCPQEPLECLRFTFNIEGKTIRENSSSFIRSVDLQSSNMNLGEAQALGLNNAVQSSCLSHILTSLPRRSFISDFHTNAGLRTLRQTKQRLHSSIIHAPELHAILLRVLTSVVLIEMLQAGGLQIADS